MLKAVANFIATNTSFTFGTTIQYGWRPPDAPDRCHLVSEPGPSPPDFYLPDKTDKMIQVLTRAPNMDDARNDALEVFDFLNGAAGWELPEIVAGKKYFAMVIEAISQPQYIGMDESEFHEYSTNYLFKIRDRD